MAVPIAHAPLQHVTGPVLFLVDGVFVGTAERCPLVEGGQEWMPVYNDFGGPMVQFDASYQGETKLIVIDLNYYDGVLLNDLINFGTDSYLSRGSLQVQGGNSFAVTLKFTFYGTPNATVGLPPGEHYFSCRIVQTYFDPMGTPVRKVRLVIEAQSVFNPANGSFSLYSTNPVYFP